jgi:hypothetical protein
VINDLDSCDLLSCKSLRLRETTKSVNYDSLCLNLVCMTFFVECVTHTKHLFFLPEMESKTAAESLVCCEPDGGLYLTVLTYPFSQTFKNNENSCIYTLL